MNLIHAGAFLLFLLELIRDYIMSMSLELFMLSNISKKFNVIIVKDSWTTWPVDNSARTGQLGPYI